MTNIESTFDKATELEILVRYVPNEVILPLGYTEDELRQLGFDEERIAALSHQRAEFDANQAAQEAAEAHLALEVAKGKALLERLPANPTYADLRELIWSDNAKRLESAGIKQ